MTCKGPRSPLSLLFILTVILGGCASGSHGDVSLAEATEAAAPAVVSADDAADIDLVCANPTADRGRIRIIRRGATSYLPLHLEFKSEASCKAFAVPGISVVSRFEKWADVLTPTTKTVIDRVTRAKGLLKLEVGGAKVVPPPLIGGPSASRATPERIVRGSLNELTGKGVIVAIIDSGIDFRHADFITYDARRRPTSRLLWFWDTTSNNHSRGIGKKAPVTYPNGAPIGTVYSRADLTAALRGRNRIGLTDTNGHGTSCAGVAAGNGNAQPNGRYTGVASKSDLIGVRIGGSSGRGLENAFLLGAICGWLDSVAGSRPCVVSCSFGGQRGGRDGSHVLERQLDARFPQSKRGRAICIAAGNEGRSALHARVSFKKNAPGTISWKIRTGKAATISVYVDDPTYKTLHWSLSGPRLPPNSIRGYTDPVTRRPYWKVKSIAGDFKMKLKSLSAKRVVAHAYITSGGKFVGPTARAGTQIASPGTTRQAVTVGSYDFNDQLLIATKMITLHPATLPRGAMTIGALSRYSNPGPRRDNVFKPDLAAPGQFHIAAAPANKVPWDRKHKRERTGKYRPFNGTSAATPYCAGIVALMLEKNPKLSVGQIQALLHGSATRDAFTGATPNARWGYGKLDLSAIRRLLSKVK